MGHQFNTKSVHVTMKRDGGIPAKVTPIHQTSAFTFENLADIEHFFEGERNYLYTRVGNPNTNELGQAVADLEEAPSGLATSSGLSAIMVGVLAAVKPGEHVVASNDLYGGTYELLANELTSFGIEVSFVSFEEDIEPFIQDNTVLLYTESLTNPLLRVEDLNKVVDIAKKHNLKTMVDNTFATPYIVRPYTEGVNLVVHSATKYIGGHSDITAGVLVGDTDLIAAANTKCVNLGSNLSPFEAWLTVRGLKTLAVRMERHVHNAKLVAEALTDHPAVDKVYYPEFISEKGNGAIVSIDITESANVEQFLESLGWIKIVATLAGVETSVSYPLATSHRSLPPESQKELGITKGLIRISVGIEEAEDIIQALKQALDIARK
ncbi:aminotransferase class I/II-fold pyridoxal phosphate-dependent enzyme [Gracilibacillus caseinilyticus]|uniref:Aminotransferase class I/II-fold pyridoxal phosphate-dependent enzyme n=1 Tax=Gracilibacillus caseinilyticus TaxID=2932256 RepID=A0ABY4ERC5_9BACI|nr:aminotransferase class I/II-fold pyridoxal phosphate-dependent enzyme [Gracilibacillus caseinilyticus]UOQ46774.1 aminotransferase class I/II-fold pyridoxal phosphate-dependent enzyme [Gracilibacillus caseinilyticus]